MNLNNKLMDTQQFYTPAFPTFPVQNQFGSTQMSFGLNSVEYATIHIAAGMAGQLAEKILPETIAQYAHQIALACFEICNDELMKLSVAPPETTGQIIKP